MRHGQGGEQGSIQEGLTGMKHPTVFFFFFETLKDHKKQSIKKCGSRCGANLSIKPGFFVIGFGRFVVFLPLFRMTCSFLGG